MISVSSLASEEPHLPVSGSKCGSMVLSSSMISVSSFAGEEPHLPVSGSECGSGLPCPRVGRLSCSSDIILQVGMCVRVC